MQRLIKKTLRRDSPVYTYWWSEETYWASDPDKGTDIHLLCAYDKQIRFEHFICVSGWLWGDGDGCFVPSTMTRRTSEPISEENQKICDS